MLLALDSFVLFGGGHVDTAPSLKASVPGQRRKWVSDARSLAWLVRVGEIQTCQRCRR